jgi:hypothetical protein
MGTLPFLTYSNCKREFFFWQLSMEDRLSAGDTRSKSTMLDSNRRGSKKYLQYFGSYGNIWISVPYKFWHVYCSQFFKNLGHKIGGWT